MLAAVVAFALFASSCSAGAESGCGTADPDISVARVWNEATLDAIRRDFPAPTVHSRNLFHVSAAMWDAWAAFDDTAVGYFVDTEAEGDQKAREEAMSYAAYRVLSNRYQYAYGASDSRADFDAAMESLCFDTRVTTTEGDSPAALGHTIAEAVLTSTRDDGSQELEGYNDYDYVPVNEPLVVEAPGAGNVADPNRWQPLALDLAVSQNGIPLPENIQTFVGPHWGNVAPFAIEASATGLPIDPGPPPYLGDPESDEAYRDGVVEVIRHSSLLDPDSGVTIDVGPGAIGNNPLGTNEGAGYDVNPITGLTYQPNVVSQGDFARVVAEFWADGPQSETPPGHWNTLANEITDHEAFEYLIGGTGEAVDRLEWDVKMYLALNGALHDAAIAAWGTKGYYDYVRPITAIRYMGGLGQSTDPDLRSYHPDGLPLEPGLIEVITELSTASGERHQHLSDHVGEIAVLAWAGNPADAETQIGGVDWIRAVEWVPYQQATFVTPAFAGYVSGHSAFSRAAAEVLTSMTGSPFFPGGLGEWTIAAESLEFEAGPAADILLQWATYRDAADQAGQSRLYGGIHVPADDLAGRKIGAECGAAAWTVAQTYFAGTATS